MTTIDSVRATTTLERAAHDTPSTGRRLGIAALGAGVGAGLGALVAMRGGSPTRGAAIGAALVGGLAFVASGGVGGGPRGREIGTIPTTITFREPTGTSREVTGTRRDADGVEREYRETVTEYREASRDVLSKLLVSGEGRHASLDAYLGAVDLSASASDSASGLVVIRRDGADLLVGHGRAWPSGSTNPASVAITDPDTVAVVGWPMYLESSDYRRLEHPVTYGPAATAADRRAIAKELA